MSAKRASIASALARNSGELVDINEGRTEAWYDLRVAVEHGILACERLTLERSSGRRDLWKDGFIAGETRRGVASSVKVRE